jgi:hypothetical protein
MAKSENEEKSVDTTLSLWYSIKAVAERRGNQVQKI